ncbi:hypothetical protein GCM10011575_27620 [Microlunatus endophyticus]|uniref:DUF1997 domain-containing protein n=1 Tax=Microlunatus endophyticus TaxID=1716077 RepID=A0A917SC25_9ACTN|nr:hypothetical protein [Microlunatus endophyticus]GGL67575.1 hypothetical protein GCM10011575_27620 [Microlunatus endophyticus]
MARLRCSVRVPGIDVERLIDAVPILIARCRTVDFSDGGVATVDGRRHPELRLVGGVAGQVGATYELDPDAEGAADMPAAVEIRDGGPFRFTVTSDQSSLLRAEVFGTDPGRSTGTIRSSGWVQLDGPDAPQSASMAAEVGMPSGMPAIFGRSVRLEAGIRLHDFWFSEPQARFSARSAAVKVGGTFRVEQSTVESWLIQVDLRVRPRGLLLVPGVLLPLFRSRLERALSTQPSKAMSEIAEELQDEFEPGDGPEQVADQIWADLTEPVPRD